MRKYRSRRRQKKRSDGKSPGPKSRILRRSNQLRSALGQRDRQLSNVNFDMSQVLHNTVRDVAHADVHNFYQRRNNPNIRAAAGERIGRRSLSTLAGATSRARHLTQLRTHARVRNLRRRSSRARRSRSPSRR